VRAGQFIISKIDARNGACGFIPDDLDGAVVTGDFPVYDLGTDVDQRFMDYVVDQEHFWYLCRLASEGTTNRVRLSPERFEELDFVLPPLPEQRRIAEILSSIDDAIERTEAVVERVQEVTRALAQELLTRGMPGRHTRFKQTAVGEIPERWEVVRLGDVLLRIEAGNSPLCEDRPAGPDEWGVLKVSSVSWGEFQPDENKTLPPDETPNPATEVKPGDLLISRANTPELVGRLVFVRNTPPRLLLSDKTLRLVPCRDTALPRYVHLALSQPHLRASIERDATGSSRSMRNISQASLRMLQFALPGIDEQRAIVERLDGFDERAQREVVARDQLASIKASLAEMLLSGRVRVNTASEPTEAMT